MRASPICARYDHSPAAAIAPLRWVGVFEFRRFVGALEILFFFCARRGFFFSTGHALELFRVCVLSGFSRSELMDLAPPPLLLHLLFFLGNVSAFLPVVRSSGFCHFDCAIARFCLDFPNQFLACLTLITIR